MSTAARAIIAGLALLAFAPRPHASTIIFDDFLGSGSPNTTYWNPAANGNIFPSLDGSTDVTIPSFTTSVLIAQPAFARSPANAPLVLSFKVSSLARNVSMGFFPVTGSDSIQIRDDTDLLSGLVGGTGGTPGDWILFTHGAGGYREVSLGVAAAAGATGTWSLYWTTSGVQISLDGNRIFDTATQPPSLGGGSWSLPTAASLPTLQAFYDGTHNPSGLLDSLDFESIPEPSTCLLLLAGGAVLYGCRRGRHRC